MCSRQKFFFLVFLVVLSSYIEMDLITITHFEFGVCVCVCAGIGRYSTFIGSGKDRVPYSTNVSGSLLWES